LHASPKRDFKSRAALQFALDDALNVECSARAAQRAHATERGSVDAVCRSRRSVSSPEGRGPKDGRAIPEASRSAKCCHPFRSEKRTLYRDGPLKEESSKIPDSSFKSNKTSPATMPLLSIQLSRSIATARANLPV
jgi:hypothetical protein